MKRIVVTVSLLLGICLAAAAQTISLDGCWQFRFDKGAVLEDVVSPSFEATDIMTVPGCFDVTRPYMKQRGTAQYRKIVNIEKAVTNAYWDIEGMGLRGSFYVDGRPIGTSCLPYSHLEFQTGPLTAGEHIFTAALDNNFDAEKLKLFHEFYDFYAFGGFYHGMSLKLQTQKVQLDRVLVRTRDINTGEVELELVMMGDAQCPETITAAVQFDGEKWANVKFHGGKAGICVPDFKLWSPEEPNLHTVRVKWQDVLAQSRFGIRSIETKGRDILLNGKKIYLKGVNRHESHPTFGAATPEQLMMSDVLQMKSMGINFVRGAHYQQSQRFLDICDEEGILVWEESLGWGNSKEQLADPEFIALQSEQTRIMVRQSMNHPSVIIFAFLNENRSDTKEGMDIINTLIDVIKAEDSGRLTTFACNRTSSDIGNKNTDIIAFNSYPGWISNRQAGTPENLKSMVNSGLDDIVRYFKDKYGEKPIIISEIGTCSIYGFRDETAAQWTEEFEAEYVGDAIDYALANPELSGITIWHFADADSFHRDGGGIRTKPLAQNLAGLVDAFRRPKLAAKVVEQKFKK